MKSATPPAVFHYPRLTQAIVDLPLLPAAFFVVAGSKVVQEGRNVGWGAAFFGLGAAFCALIWYACRAGLVTLTVDEKGVQSTAFWGLSRRSLDWAEVERVEYDTTVDQQHGYTGPKTYVLRKRNHRNRFGFWSGSILFTAKLVSFPDLLAIIEHKSAEYGFPIEQMP